MAGPQEINTRGPEFDEIHAMNQGQKLVRGCGGYQHAVDAVMALARLLRIAAFPNPGAKKTQGSESIQFYRDKSYERRTFYWEFNFDELSRALTSALPSHDAEISKMLLEHLQSAELVRAGTGSPTGRLKRSAVQPVTLARELLKNVRPDHELRYYVMSNIRRHWAWPHSAGSAHEIHVLTDLLNSAINLRAHYARNGVVNRKSGSDSLLNKLWAGTHQIPGMAYKYKQKNVAYHVGQSQAWDFSDIIKILQLAYFTEPERDWGKAIEVFLECCLGVNYLQPHERREGWVFLRTSTADSAYLLSNLYGMKTGIAGFDELFGGGGLILADDILRDQPTPMGGRAILTLGRYGTGKSLLALQFAVEVARKGGLAYVMTVEQSPEECLYSLGSVCALPPDELVEIAVGSARIRRILERQNPERGALILTNPLKDSFEDFLTTFKTDLRDMNKYPIRLVIVDAVSAIPRYSQMLSELRNETLTLLQEAKSAATNIWLIAEEGTERLSYYENISDTVMRLSCEDVLPYSQRYFEITKSRFQREQRGRHPFSIQPGSGFSIFPSAAAVSARIQPRSVRPPDTRIAFGIRSLDEILGEDALFSGDVIVLQGPAGTFKTPLGLLFLLGMDKPRGGYAKERTTESLLVSSDDYQTTLRYMLPAEQSENQKRVKRTSDIRPCHISGGYVKPGYILHKIEEEFLAARLAGGAIDRVMVDNVSHWGLSCPFVQEEKTFGDTIVELLRRHQATSLFTCNELNDPNSSSLQQAIVDAADCLIQFNRIEFRGSYHVMFRVLKTRGMKHRRESFELVVGERTIDVKANSPLVRISADGRAEPMKIRLFLHNQTLIQQEENKRIINTIRSIVSPCASIETEVHDSGSLVKAWNLGTASALDELQVLQIDEFQLPDSLSYRGLPHKLPVHVFEPSQWTTEWDDLLPRLKRRVQIHKGRFVGIPMYENVGLLAFRSDYKDSGGGGIEAESCSWAFLAEQCELFESRSHDNTSLFFEFATIAKENYNCLFLEILLSLSSPRPPVHYIKPRLQDWLSEEASSPMVIQAGKIYRRLCRRTHFRNKQQENQNPVYVERKAIVWRLWYSELSQMLANMDGNERRSITVSGLPKNMTVPGKAKTVSIAGEWYLTVPAYSAAQDVGLEIIKMLTTHDSEFMRTRVGLGLPTRSSFYRSQLDGNRLNDNVAINTKDLQVIVNHAFARSYFDSYSKLSNVLTLHLKRMIELPDQEEPALEKAIKNILADFCEQANFIRY